MKKYLIYLCLFCLGCAANTLYDSQGTGIYTVLDLMGISARLLSFEDAANQEGLARLSTLYGVDIQTAFNATAGEMREFIATLKELRDAMEQRPTRTPIDPEFFEEFDELYNGLAQQESEVLTIAEETRYYVCSRVDPWVDCYCVPITVIY
jgi:hypothetical protein